MHAAKYGNCVEIVVERLFCVVEYPICVVYLCFLLAYILKININKKNNIKHSKAAKTNSTCFETVR